jgi:hypothetical protein
MVNRADTDILLYAVGDVGPDRANPDTIFQHVTDVLRRGDIASCQLEVMISHRGMVAVGPQAGFVGPKGGTRDPQTAVAIKDAGFNVVSFASNHCLNAGYEAFFDTIDNLKEQGLWVIGVGRNIEEARRPAIIEVKGTRIAFLAYNSVLQDGFWAEDNRPGCAPIRVWTLYEPLDPHQPGLPSRKTHTFPYTDDLKAMVEDIKRAKVQADLVIVSMHCGIRMMPAVIAEYQVAMAHAAIDAGADLTLQHHAHMLRGIEVYSDKVIFYGLGNFAEEVYFMTEEWAQSTKGKEDIKYLNPDWNPPYPDYPSYPFPPDSRKTIIVKCTINNKEINRLSFLPAYINNKAEPEILAPENGRFGEVVRYMEEITEDQGLATKYTIDGDEVIVHK